MIQGSDVSDVPRPRGRALEAPSTIVSLQEQRGSACCCRPRALFAAGSLACREPQVWSTGGECLGSLGGLQNFRVFQGFEDLGLDSEGIKRRVSSFFSEGMMFERASWIWCHPSSTL